MEEIKESNMIEMDEIKAEMKVDTLQSDQDFDYNDQPTSQALYVGGRK